MFIDINSSDSSLVQWLSLEASRWVGVAMKQAALVAFHVSLPPGAGGSPIPPDGRS